MDYSRFVRLRSPVWERFESALASGRRRSFRLDHGEVEDLALGYRQILHDHALASHRFPGTHAARRLRSLALQGARWLHRSGGDERFRLLRFLGRDFPRAVRSQLPVLGVTVTLFAGALLFGLLLVALRPQMGTAFLGEEAVAGLRQGRLWTESLVTTVPAAAASSRIATNNVSVALLAWAGGAAGGLLGLYVVLLNGFSLGAVLGVTLHYSMAGELLEFVSAHGFLELTLILVSAAAGLSVGRALVEADDRPRGEAVREAARRSLTVLAGCVPWFLVLGLVEAFVSPSPEISVGLKLTVGLALELLFLNLALRPFLPARGSEAPADV